MDFSSPPATGPAIQAWGPKIPRELHTTSETQVESGVSSANYPPIDREKEKMAREIQDLKEQVKTLLQRSKTPGPVQQPNIDMSVIIKATTEAVMNIVSQQRRPELINAPTDTREVNSAANADEDNPDMSLDSTRI